MKIETTVNISYETFVKIKDSAEFLNTSKSDIILQLLHLHLEDIKLSALSFSRVTYQKRRSSSDWCTLHVYLDSVSYEKFLDLRKLFKFSVSFIVDYLVNNFLYLLISGNKTNSPDNYWQNYLFSCEINGKILKYTMYWYIPTQEQLQKNNN